MISLALIAAASAIASGVYSGIKGNKAKKKADAERAKQNQMAAQYKQDATNEYNKEMSQGYLDRSDTKAALERIRQNLFKNYKYNDNAAAMSGSTPEMQLAMQKNAQEQMANATAQVASGADNWRDSIRNRYDAKLGNAFNMEMGLSNSALNNYYNQVNSNMQAVGSAIGSLGNIATAYGINKYSAK